MSDDPVEDVQEVFAQNILMAARTAETVLMRKAFSEEKKAREQANEIAAAQAANERQARETKTAFERQERERKAANERSARDARIEEQRQARDAKFEQQRQARDAGVAQQRSLQEQRRVAQEQHRMMQTRAGHAASLRGGEYERYSSEKLARTWAEARRFDELCEGKDPVFKTMRQKTSALVMEKTGMDLEKEFSSAPTGNPPKGPASSVLSEVHGGGAKHSDATKINKTMLQNGARVTTPLKAAGKDLTH